MESKTGVVLALVTLVALMGPAAASRDLLAAPSVGAAYLQSACRAECYKACGYYPALIPFCNQYVVGFMKTVNIEEVSKYTFKQVINSDIYKTYKVIVDICVTPFEGSVADCTAVAEATSIWLSGTQAETLCNTLTVEGYASSYAESHSTTSP